MIEATGRSRAGNPGIVPPYLAKAGVAVPTAGPLTGRDKLTIVLPAELFDRLVCEQRPVVSAADKQAALQAVGAAQQLFSRLGLGEREGNGGRLPIVFDPTFENAAFGMTQCGQELLQIGNDRGTGKSYAQAADVMVHEYTHRVLHHLVGFEDGGEPGIVNESLADTFAAAIDGDDWTIGEDVVPGGVRSMDNPERAQDAIRTGMGETLRPGHARDFVSLPNHPEFDDGGVHVNVGIPNKAASIIGKRLGRDAMAKIYMDATVNYLRRDSGIAQLAAAVQQSAADLFGPRSHESNVVNDAWTSVGLGR